MLFRSIPIVIVFFSFGPEIVGSLFFNKANFPYHAILTAGVILSVYSLGFLSYVAEIIVLQTFFSYRDALTPTAVAVACAGIHVVILFAFFGSLGWLVFPVAYLISRTVKAIALFFLLLPRLKGGLEGEGARWLSFALRTGGVTLLGFAAAWAVGQFLPELTTESAARMLCMKRAFAGGIAVTLVCAIGFWFLRVPETREAIAVLGRGFAKVAKLVKR